MSTCLIPDCHLEAYENEDKCILHCEKHEYSQDFHKVGFLRTFYDELINLIIELLQDDVYNSENLIAYLKDELTENEKGLIETHLMDKVVVFTQIFFPQSKDIDSFEYKKLLRKLWNIHFNYCEFSISYIDLHKSKCFFQDCKFHNGLLLYNLDILENESDVLFQMCEFSGKVTSFSENKKTIIENSLFCDCTILELILEDTTFNKPIFNNEESFHGNIENIEILNCTIEDRFILNYHGITTFNISNSIFKDKVEVKKARNIEDISIINCNFKGLVDFYNSNFDNSYIYKSIFEDFVGFEYCHFGISYEKCENCSTKFKYVTFLSFVNMRNTSFISGLDMSDANLKEYPNFLGTNINPVNTNKETFRIIKHSFDKIGNTSEANKYFSYEMAKERKEIQFWGNPEKKIMLTMNYVLSNFGQSYLLPLVWIFIVMILHKLSIEWVNMYSIIDTFPKYGYILEWSIGELNSLVKNITPLERFFSNGMEFTNLLFYIIYSVLIYHFIVAVKRLTKR